MSTAGLIVMFAMYFIYMHREKKKRRKIEREEEEEAASIKKASDELRKEASDRLVAKRKYNEEVLSKISYPDPSTASLDEMYDFIESLDYDSTRNDIVIAYSELVNKKRDIGSFYCGYLDSRVIGKFTK